MSRRGLSVAEQAELMARIRRDPAWFAATVLRRPLWSAQRALVESVRDHPRTAVKAGHGVGKTVAAAVAALWWLASWRDAIVITTSATWAQVREQLWREVAAAVRDCGIPRLFGGPDALTDVRLELGEQWFAAGFSTDTPERFAGYHSPHLLVVIDEASGVSEQVWEAAETLITTAGSRLLAIGNPTRPSGAFFRAFTSERELYSRLTIPVEASPAFTGEAVPAGLLKRLPSREWLEGRRRAWGEASPLWAMRVAGEFAEATDDTVVALGELEQARKRSLEPGSPAIVAVDVARFGSDETVIVSRRGARVRVERVLSGRDTMTVAGEVVRVARRHQAESREVPTVVVDDAGLGGGVTDRLRELGGLRVIAFNGAERAHDPAEYPNRRSEAWFQLAERLPELDLDGDERLAADLLAPRYSIDSRGRRVVEAKELTKRRLGRSPDRGDAVVMAVAVGDPAEAIAASIRQLEQRREALRRDPILRDVESAPGRDVDDLLRDGLTSDLLEARW